MQRWERELGLPVHRIGTGSRSPVYAVTAELNFWLGTSGALREAKPRVQLAKMQPRGGKAAQPRGGKALQESRRRLLAEVRALAQIIADTSVRQRKQAEDLKARIIQMRARITK